MTIISSNKLHKRDFNVDRMEEIKEVRPEINFTTCKAAKAFLRVVSEVHFVEGFLFEKTKKTWKWSSFGVPHVGSTVTISFFCLHVKWFIAGPPFSKITTNSHPGFPTTPWSLASRATPARCGWPAGDWLEQCVCRFHHLLAPAEGYQRSLQWRRCTRSWDPNSSKTDLVGKIARGVHAGGWHGTYGNETPNSKRKTMWETWMVREVDYVSITQQGHGRPPSHQQATLDCFKATVLCPLHRRSSFHTPKSSEGARWKIVQHTLNQRPADKNMLGCQILPIGIIFAIIGCQTSDNQP